MPLRRPRRAAGFSYLGVHQYLLTFCTLNRRTLFVSETVARTVLLQFYRVARDETFAILAYCLMPDHVHLVVEGLTETSDLRKFVKMAKQRSALALRTEGGLHGVWQEGYHDWVVRSDQAIEDVIRYVLENPVRAKLVLQWQDYPYSGTSIRFW